MSARKYLDEVQARADKATPSLDLTRYAHGGGRMFVRGARLLVADFYDEANREFYAAARTDVPKLAAMLRIALDALDRVAYGPGLHSNEAAAHLAEIDRRAGEER